MYRGTIKNGGIEWASPAVAAAFQDFKRTREGAHIIVTEEKPSRTSSQNNFYWVYLGVIANETGDTATDLHEFFKRKLLPPVIKKVRGEEIKIAASTTDLDKIAFGEYLDKICALTNIPLPDPAAAGYISNV